MYFKQINLYFKIYLQWKQCKIGKNWENCFSEKFEFTLKHCSKTIFSRSFSKWLWIIFAKGNVSKKFKFFIYTGSFQLNRPIFKDFTDKWTDFKSFYEQIDRFSKILKINGPILNHFTDKWTDFKSFYKQIDRANLKSVHLSVKSLKIGLFVRKMI